MEKGTPPPTTSLTSTRGGGAEEGMFEPLSFLTPTQQGEVKSEERTRGGGAEEEEGEEQWGRKVLATDFDPDLLNIHQGE